MIQKSPFHLTSTSLRIIALAAMLSDHLWAMIIPGNQWMNYIGRLAFPIFAFQIVEGFLHTSNFKRYTKRLLLFGCLSEIPFDLMYASTIFYPFHQNVMFTLLLGLLAIGGLERAKKIRTWQAILGGALALLATCLAATIGMTDYGAKGVLTIVAFYVFRQFPWAYLGQLVSLILLNMVFFKGLYLPIELFGQTFEFQTQGFAVLALIPIWLYNGEKGHGGRMFQYGSYLFYPAHMLVLYGIKALL